MSERHNRGQASRMNLRFAWLTPDDLKAARAEWVDLTQNALSANPFYAPGFVLAHTETAGWAEGVHCAGVWHEGPQGRRLDALAFITRDDLRWGWPIRTWRSWSEKYILKFEPLYRAETAGLARHVLFDGLSENGRERTLLLNREETWQGPLADGPPAETGKAQCVRTGRRAGLFARPDVDAYMRAEVSKKFRANAERSLRRLADLGDVTFRTVRTGPEVDAAVGDLMRLELAGWKGRQGTALASCAQDKAFGLAALRAGQCPKVVCDVLSLNGTAIAVSVNVVSAGWFFGFKSAFDEGFKKQSPGTALHYLGARAILEDSSIIGADSTCVEGHPLESVWCDRISFATTIRSVGAPISASRLKYVLQTEAMRGSAKSTVKTIYYSASSKKVTATKR
ncbi:MAG: GNAT family N-acetyltransferase [Pseudomonadota bacterium]